MRGRHIKTSLRVALAPALALAALSTDAWAQQVAAPPTAASASSAAAQPAEDPILPLVLTTGLVYAAGFGLRVANGPRTGFPWPVIPIAGPPIETKNDHTPAVRALLWADGVLEAGFTAAFLAYALEDPAAIERQRDLERRTKPYEGGAVPPGARIEKRADDGLSILAAGGLAFSYQPSLFVGLGCAFASDCGSLGWLLVPAAGPFVALGWPQSTLGKVLLVTDGAVQVLSIAALVGAVVHTHRVMILPPGSATSAQRPHSGFALGAPGAAAGASWKAELPW